MKKNNSSTTKILTATALFGSLFLTTQIQAQNLLIVNQEPVLLKHANFVRDQLLKGQNISIDKLNEHQKKELNLQLKGEFLEKTLLAQEAKRLNETKQFISPLKISMIHDMALIQGYRKQLEKNAEKNDTALLDLYKKQVKNAPKEYHAKHILVKTLEEAQKIQQALKAGKTFEQLAQEFSQDPGSSSQGGDLGWADPSNFVPEFATALRNLKAKTISEPVKTQFGYHLINLVEEPKAGISTSFKDVKTDLVKQLAEQEWQKTLETVKAKFKNNNDVLKNLSKPENTALKARIDEKVKIAIGQVLAQQGLKLENIPAQAKEQMVKSMTEHTLESEELVKIATNKGIAALPETKLLFESAKQAGLIMELRQFMERDIRQDETALTTEYNQVIAKLKNDGGQYHARHILVPTLEQATQIAEKLKNGGDFLALAKEFSKDPGSAKNGGDLDWNPPATYVPEFANALKTLKVMEVSAPVQTQFGFHLIRLEEAPKAVEVPPLNDMIKTQLAREIVTKKWNEMLQKLKKQAKVQGLTIEEQERLLKNNDAEMTDGHKNHDGHAH